MISWRLVFPAVMVAAALAVCFTYFVPPRPPRVEVNQLIPPTVPDLIGRETQTPRNIDPRPSAEEQAAKAFEGAAKAILERAPDARASAGTDGPLITGPKAARSPAHDAGKLAGHLAKIIVTCGPKSGPASVQRLSFVSQYDDSRPG
jgi:hypothetical protein